MLSPATWPLRLKLTLLLLAAAVLPLAAVTALWLREAGPRAEAEALALLDARADQLASELDAFVGRYDHMTRRMAQLPRLVRYCAGDAGVGADVQEVLERTAADDPRLRGLAVFDRAGTITLTTEPPLLGRSYAFREYFQVAVRGQATTADLYLAVPEIQSVPSIAHAAPVLAPDGAVLGVLVTYVHAAALWATVRRGDDRAGRGSSAVLVIDDHDPNRALVEGMLEPAGLRVLGARDGPSGLALARAERPALVLLDIAMPGMDGFAVLGALRADPATRDLPVVALTALAMRSDEERIRDAGFDGYLTKPVDRERLLEEVERLRARRSAAEET